MLKKFTERHDTAGGVLRDDVTLGVSGDTDTASGYRLINGAFGLAENIFITILYSLYIRIWKIQKL